MALPILLGVLAGVALYASLSHALLAARSRVPGPHVNLAVIGAAVAGSVILTAAAYTAETAANYATYARWDGFFLTLAVIGLFRFVSAMTGMWPRWSLRALTVVLVVVAMASLAMPAGIFFADVQSLRTAETILGPVTLPVATSNPWQMAFNLPVWGGTAYVFWVVLRCFRKGRTRLATIIGVGMAMPVVPGFIDTFLLGPDVLPLPYFSMAVGGLVVFLGILLSDEVAREAEGRQAVERVAARMRALVEYAPAAMFLLDPDTRETIVANWPAAAFLDLEPDEVGGVNPLARAPKVQPDGRRSEEVAEDLVRRALDGERVDARWSALRSNGTVMHCEIFLALVPHPEEDGASLLRVAFLDVSRRAAEAIRRRSLEARLRRAERLETIGGLAGGVAHEFNNLLLPMVAYGEILWEELPPGTNRDYVERIQRAAHRARELVHQILSFSRRGEPEIQPLPMQAALKEVADLLGTVFPASVRIERSFEAPDLLVDMDPMQLRQMLMNLGSNAVEALPEGGTVRLAFREVERPEEWSGAGPSERDRAALIEFADDGVGMDPETVQRIFDPFFSTREVGRGTGLGLSVVHGIVTMWGGIIDVRSAEGEGTEFRIWLPIAGRVGAALEGTSPPAGESIPDGEHVLLVDDRPEIVDALGATLRKLGYTVSGFTSARVALEHARTHPPDAAVVDFDMPEMNGIELTRELREVHAGLPVALLSGSNRSFDEASREEGSWSTILKPVRRADLDRVLRDLLGRAD